jgi:hypothetical protein
MKTSDLHIADLGSNGSNGSLRSLLNLEWLGGGKAKKKRKFKAGTHPSANGTPDGKTKVSQSLADVLKLMRADGARKVGVFGDKSFADLVGTQAAEFSQVWLSQDFVNDQPLGAKPISAKSIAGLDAIVVGGSDIATRFRYAVREMASYAPDVPVHFVAENWEFCAGTAAVPAEIDNCEALVFNHFEEFFGIKDALQFRFEVISEAGIKRVYRVLGPNESVNLNLNQLAGIGPDGRRNGAVCLKIYVAHPYLTRGRHYRFRICGDVFWKDSFTIIHGSHQFFKDVNKLQEFRLIESVVRNGHVLVTVPNYDLDMGQDDSVQVGSGAEKLHQRRSRTKPVEVVDFERKPVNSADRRYFATAYRGYGTSFWYALEEGFSPMPGKQASIAANHLCRVGVDNRADIAFRPEELDIVRKTIDAGFMIYPTTLPVSWGKDDLVFGFNFDASNPPFEDYLIRFYDAEGQNLGLMNYRKDFIGPVVIDEVIKLWDNPHKARAVTALVAPDYVKAGLAPQRTVTTADMLVRHVKTGDQDFTEFQNSWRNLEADIPTLPHWLHPSIGVIGRTNVIGRVRCKDGMRTGVFLANASGNLNYDMTARVEISAINNAGRRLSHFLTLPAFGSKIVWLDDALPDLAHHIGPSGVATLQVKSPDADLTAHVLGLTPTGAVGLQHLWGY